MAQSKTLADRIHIRELPAFTPPTAPEAPVLKRLLLPQGELAQIWDGDPSINYIAYIELSAGSVRGNHYHLEKEEHVYLVHGQLTLVLEDTESKERLTLEMKTGSFVCIPTRIAHALRVNQSGGAIEFSTAHFNPDDTFKYPL